jgi:hypothetical protein
MFRRRNLSGSPPGVVVRPGCPRTPRCRPLSTGTLAPWTDWVPRTARNPSNAPATRKQRPPARGPLPSLLPLREGY